MSTDGIVARVVNDKGRAFNVRLVRMGERYGLNDKLVHDSADPMIEFWDATYERDARFTLGRGQFVARYYLKTLQRERNGYGLDMLGHVPEWKITAANVRDAIQACERALLGIDRDRLVDVLENAREAFWRTIGESFPEITTGDFTPDAHNAFQAASERALLAWLEANKR